MICKTQRQVKKKFSSSDFQFYVSLFKKKNFTPVVYNKKDTAFEIEKIADLPCYLKIKGVDFESNGELIRGGSEMECISYIFEGFEEVYRNHKNYILNYNNNDYILREADYIDGDTRSFYVKMIAERINKQSNGVQ